MLINPDAPTDKPETEQMVVIHRTLRREFRNLPSLVAAVRPADTARARVVGDHLALVLTMLHEHHEAEDMFLWPILMERVPLEKDLIGLMETQHQAIADAVAVIGSDLPTWTAQADAAVRDRIADALRGLEKALTVHLDLEESKVLPLMHEHLTVPEWLVPQKHALKHGPKTLAGKLNLAGMVLEDATPRQRAWFLGEMPAPARVLWRLVGARRYVAYTRTVRATEAGATG
ncbi:hemerythrin domain-containing protein [Streptomyces sp. NPDC018057]|uniref:hemerythrin domain-containing protein n=1 Tax=unclassified Streptomyces TaxID=2593676 RepID=UPI00379702BC